MSTTMSTPCVVCGQEASQKCSLCKVASYCSKEHHAEAWKTHKYYCHEPWQMGAYVRGQDLSVLPVFMSKSTGDLTTMPRNTLAKLIGCMRKDLEFMIAPISTLFDQENRIVVAFHGGPPPTQNPKSYALRQFPPGELCNHAVHMTRSLKDSYGYHITGAAVFFYLKPGKPFFPETDWTAVSDAIRKWDNFDYPEIVAPSTLRKLAVVFHDSLANPSEWRGRDTTLPIGHHDVIIFPASETRPFIARMAVRLRHYDPSTIEIGESDDLEVMKKKWMDSMGHEWIVNFGRLRTTSIGNGCLVLHQKGSSKSRQNLAIKASVGPGAAMRWSEDVFVIRLHPNPSQALTDVAFEDMQQALDFLRDGSPST